MGLQTSWGQVTVNGWCFPGLGDKAHLMTKGSVEALAQFAAEKPSLNPMSGSE
jgi:hypothetical protein